MAVQLWDFQEVMVDQARNMFRSGKRSILLQLSTGGGKTVVACHILRRAVEKGAYCHFWVHRKELLRQSVRALKKEGIECGIIAAGYPETPDAPVQVCSIQTLPNRLGRIRRPDLVVPDEFHHAASKTLSALIEYYPAAKFCSLSATPNRLDGQGLRPWAEAMICGPSTRELIARGFLSPYELYTPGKIDLSGIHTKMGDYDQQELAARMKASGITGDALKHYQMHAPGSRALIFTWSIESSMETAHKFIEAGIPAAHLDGTTPDKQRDQIIDDFSDGRLMVMSNVGIVSEGFDVPGLDALFLLRPTKSLVVHLQQIGRGLRAAPGKKLVKIFDHANNSINLGLPDGDYEWSLDGRPKQKRGELEQPKARVCPQCNLTSPLSVRVCPNCGMKLVMEREMEINEKAELNKVDIEAMRKIQRKRDGFEMYKADDLQKLTELGRRKGHKHPKQWAEYVLRARQEKEFQRELKRATKANAEAKAAGLQPSLPIPDQWNF